MIKQLIPSSIKKVVRTALHAGNTYHCPICGYDAKDLYPIGFDIPVLKEKEVVGAGRRNSGCYKCNSSDRDRLIHTYLVNKLNMLSQPKDLKILHIAPETRISRIFLSNGYVNYICGDLYTEGYSYPAYVRDMDVLHIPFEDDHFDMIICNHVLEHVPNDAGAMKELYRVLKPGGKAILQVPISKNSDATFEDPSITEPKDREVVFGQFDHVRIYGQDYTERLRAAGFTPERVHISAEFPRYGLNRNEDIFIGKK